MNLQSLSRLGVTLVVMALAAVFASRAAAQDQLESLKKLEGDRSKHYTTLSKLKGGQEKPTAADKDAIDAEAMYLVYRFTTVQLGDPERMKKYQKDFTDTINQLEYPENKKGNRQFVQQLSPVLVKRFQALLDMDDEKFLQNSYAIINAAPMLPQAARLKDEAIGNYCADLIASKTRSDAIKLHAVRGLREYLPIAVIPDDSVLADATARRKARDVRYVDALVSYIERKGGDKLSVPEQNAIRVLRREALETLAGANAPAVFAFKGKVDGPIAPVFLRVLAPKNSFDVPPGLTEKIEAAIGVCQIKYASNANNNGFKGPAVPDYQPEIGVYLVGRLIHEFATEYNKDLVDIRANKPAMIHWRYQAKRLEAALKDLSANAKGHAIDAKVKSLEKAASDANLFPPMQGKMLNQVNQNGLLQFGKMVMTLRPPTANVYRSHKGFQIDLEEPPVVNPAP
jgi:hypothetical protein